MNFKPMPPRLFEKYLKIVGWHMEKGSVDWKLYDENEKFLCTIQISHGNRTKSEVTARSLQKVEKEFKEKGWLWPPQKKLKKS